MLEAAFRIVMEVIFLGLLRLIGRIGYWITHGVVSTFFGSRIFVAPPPNNYVMITRWHGVHRLTDGTPVIGQGLASALGLILLATFTLAILIGLKVLRS